MADSLGLVKALEEAARVQNTGGRVTDRQDSEFYGTTMNPNPRAAGANQTTQTAAGAGATAASNGMSPLTGFAARYTPETLRETIYDNPWFILRDVFNGMNETSPGYQGLRDIGGDPLALYNIMAGANGTIANDDTSMGDFTNFLAQMYQNLGTPGGQGFDAQELLGNIFGQNTTDPQSTLGNLLVAGDMNQQIRTLFNLLRDVSSTSMNPLAASAYQAAAARAGDRYGNQMLQTGAGDQTHILDWINQNMPWLTVR